MSVMGPQVVQRKKHQRKTTGTTHTLTTPLSATVGPSVTPHKRGEINVAARSIIATVEMELLFNMSVSF